MRLRTLPLALACIGMGSFLAASHGKFNLVVFILCLATTLALQIVSNLANDYGDTIHGADNEHRVGPSRSVQEGAITRSQMKRAIAIASIISLILGITLLVVSGISTQVFIGFIALGLFSLLAAVLYTNGKLPYGYIGLGDLSVFIFFGLVGVLGSYYLQTQTFSWDILLPGASCGLLTVAVLNINNIRDIHSDKLAGKYSIPVRLGRTKANIYHSLLLFLGVSTALAYVLINYESPRQFLFLLTIPMLILNAKAIHTKPQEALDPYLKQMAMTSLLFVLIFGLSII